MRILGIDPGLQKTGWGIIEVHGTKLVFVSSGLIKTNAKMPLYARLAALDDGISKIITNFDPLSGAIEETFMNNNAASALKLGQARGACIVSMARTGLEVSEYAANLVKKSVVGTGHATKDQMAMMVRTLLPKSGKVSEDEADALGVAICHSHFAATKNRMNNQV